MVNNAKSASPHRPQRNDATWPHRLTRRTVTSCVVQGRVPIRITTGVVAMAIRTTNVRAESEKGFQIVETTIEDVHAAYRSGTLAAKQLVQMYLDRIAAYDESGPAINSIISLNPHVLDEAERLDVAFQKSGPVGPLHGIPLVMKDQANINGMPTTLGSLLFRDFVPDSDCFVAARLKAAGAIFIWNAPPAVHQVVRVRRFRPTFAPPPSARRVSRQYVALPRGTTSPACGRQWASSAAAAYTAG